MAIKLVGAALLAFVVSLAWCAQAQQPADAVVEQIYTLPFEGQYVLSCGFGCYSGHAGTDYQLGDPNVGDHPVVAAKRGSVQLYQQFPSGAGYYIVIDHGGGHRTRYLHLNTRVVADDQVVARGQVIGYEGMTGDDDNHLHFETRHGATTWPSCCSGTAVDPYASSTFMWKTNPPSMARDMNWSDDGYPDVLARVWPSGELCLFKGNGANGWISNPDTPCGDGTSIGSGWNVFNKIFRPGDWSGDGCHDILARKSNGELWMYLGNCANGFKPDSTGQIGRSIGSGWGAFNWLIGPGDFSGDGFSDVLARKSDGKLCLFRGNGYESWIAYPTNPDCGSGKLVGPGWQVFTWIVDPRDFSGGGCMDVIGELSNGNLNLYKGNCLEGFSGQVNGMGSGWQSFESMLGVGDFSGDGCPDVLTRKFTGAPDFYSYTGNCAGGWQSGTGIGTGWWGFDLLW